MQDMGSRFIVIQIVLQGICWIAPHFTTAVLKVPQLFQGRHLKVNIQLPFDTNRITFRIQIYHAYLQHIYGIFRSAHSCWIVEELPSSCWIVEEFPVHLDSGRIAQFMLDSGRIAQFMLDSGRIAQFMLDSGRIAQFMLDSGRIAQFCWIVEELPSSLDSCPVHVG
ncbi:hypothetical protein CEXT_89701 [Caerostris extrusa]|uniref:Uncharacterized protein n=1 Tax=Caerostris extrusa TaxID=172846 RepID=A0AAV4UDV4_CAEEX|nr:hypothetical protein CEXT_89701 [Caerostris extrusa]